MANKTPLVAIVGRTNVGKSTLFNALVGRRLSIVEDQPGVTRDRSYAHVTKDDIPYTLIDTGGLVGEDDNKFQDSVQEQAQLAISEADLILVLFDGLAGPHPQDQEVLNILRRVNKPSIWVVNKCEKPATAEAAVEFYSMGLDDMHCISAAHNEGVRQLAKKIQKHLSSVEGVKRSLKGEPDAIRVAVLGKPNVGKSTFVNKILGVERVISSEIPGTTRDTIDISLKRDGQEYVLVDTAGLRKKSQISSATIERYGNIRTLRSLVQSDVALLLIDASLGVPSEQDAKIARLIHDRGIPFIIVVNKWDLVEKDHRSAKEYKDTVFDVLRFAKYAPLLFISALSGRRCPSVLAKAKEVYENAQLRVQTSEINKVFEQLFQKKPPPVFRGEPIKLFFATQVGIAPPTILLFLNHPKKLPMSYQRYLVNSFRKSYPFVGSNIKLVLKKRSVKEERLRAAN